MTRTREQISRLVGGAMGRLKADLIISGGKIVNVYSGEIIEKAEIAVLDERVCYVGPSARHARGDATQTIDATGLYVAPGFIDAHTHIGHFSRPFDYLQAYVARGTTALMASADEFASVFGFKGVQLFQEDIARHPLRVSTLISMVAPQDPLLCNTASYSEEEVRRGLADPTILGLGEIVSWLRLTQGDEEILQRIAMALNEKKIIHGHTAGAKDQKLCAVAAAGVSSCHEPIREEDALERLRLGYWLMLREGSFRRDLEATLKPLLARGISLQRLILVTDGMAPDDTEELGHMDHVLRRAVSLGLPPVQAIQAVTLNPATYAGLEQDIGGIGPGRYADFAFLEDLAAARVHSTVIGGRIVARAGKSLVTAQPIAFPPETLHCLTVAAKIRPDSFRIPCPWPEADVRVMELLNLNITAERIIRLRSAGGYLEADVGQDLLKVAVFDRHGRGLATALGFLKGFGARVGAVGTTANLDENTLLVAGGNDDDMVLCANILIESGGGIAVVDRGELLEKIDFPVAGLLSLEPWGQVAEKFGRIQRCLVERGAAFPKPVYALWFLTFVTLPSLRITSRGLVNAKERKIVPLMVQR